MPLWMVKFWSAMLQVLSSVGQLDHSRGKVLVVGDLFFFYFFLKVKLSFLQINNTENWSWANYQSDQTLFTSDLKFCLKKVALCFMLKILYFESEKSDKWKWKILYDNKKICLFRETAKVLAQIWHLCTIKWKTILCWVCCLLLPHALGLVLMMVNK